MILASVASAQTVPVCSPTLPVVVEKEGNPISSLTLADFHVRAGRHEIKVVKADYSVRPRRVVLVLNLSSAMNARQREVSASAAQKFISAASSRVPIALLTFAETGVRMSAFETQQSRIEEELRRAVNSPEAGKGRSILFDALDVAEQALSPPLIGDAIYMITNPRDSSKTADLHQLREKMVAAKIRLYAVSLWTSPFSLEKPVVAGAITDLVNDSGGFLFTLTISNNVPVSQDMPADFLERQSRIVLNLLTALYTLRLDPQAPVGEKVRIKVDMSGRADGNQVKVLYPSTVTCN